MSTRFLMLNDQNWLLTLSVIIVTRAVCAQTGERNAIVTNDLSIGERAWPSISNGVVFIDGKYIPPPYVISRNEGEIFLNGLHFDWVIQWPPKKKPIFPLIPAAEPVMPASITKNTTEYDKDYLAYTYYMRHYLAYNFKPTRRLW